MTGSNSIVSNRMGETKVLLLRRSPVRYVHTTGLLILGVPCRVFSTSDLCKK
jgi:hypothetical protein